MTLNVCSSSSSNNQVHLVTWTDDSLYTPLNAYVSLGTFPYNNDLSDQKPHTSRRTSFHSLCVSSSSSSLTVAAFNGALITTVLAFQQTGWRRFLCNGTMSHMQVLLEPQTTVESLISSYALVLCRRRSCYCPLYSKLGQYCPLMYS